MEARLLDRRGAGPAVLYLPGIDGTGRMTLGLEDRLEGFTLLRLRYAPAGPDTYPALAASAVRVLDGERVERAVLLAESFGGGVGLTLALTAPGRVRGLLLVSTFARFPHRPRLLATLCLGPLVPGRLWTALRRRYGLRLLYGCGEPEVARRFLALRCNFYDRAYHRRLRMVRRLDLRPALPRIRAPARIVAGTADRVLDAVRTGRELAAGLPRSRLEVVPGGGHLLLPRRDLPFAAWLGRLANGAL